MLLIQLAIYPANTLGNVISNSGTDSSAEKPAITVEQAVQKVKDNFAVPKNYTVLNTGYNNYNNRATYSLNWNAADQPGGSFHAEVDATTGDILNVGQWDGQVKSAFSLPVLSESEAEKKATDLITKLAGKHQAEMQLVKDEQQLFTLNYAQPFTYNFRWIRMVNGIQFPGNGVNVSVSGDDGRIINYSYNWTENLVFPEAKNVISSDQARQVFTKTPMIELQYYLPPILNPQNPQPQAVFLVYQVAGQYNGGAIDALTGKPVTLDPKAGLYRMSAISSVSAKTAAAGTAQTGKQQLSRDEAVNAVKKVIDIPSDLVLSNSSLNTDWQNPGEQVWDLNWNSDSAGLGGPQLYIYARVNAQTGDVISFNEPNITNSGDKSAPLDRAGAQKIVEDFLKRVQPEKFKLVKENSAPLYGGKMPGNMQMFNYTRLVNDIPVSNNGINLVVDTAAKQINSYNLNWSNAEFPNPTGVISLAQATEQFLKERPLNLNYLLNSLPDGKQEVRLVYQPNTDYNMYVPTMIDAKTGDPMDWYGKSQSQWNKPHIYTDIQGNYAEKEIGIIGLTGAFGEYGDAFHPEEKVTAVSLFRAMIATDGTNRDRVLKDDDVLKLAKERGWFQGDLKPDSEITRVDLAKIMIRFINMEPSAQVKGIYAVPFKDAAALGSDSLGYIALAWGLGILKVDDNTLHADQAVTRAEAAYALVHAYEVGRPQNNYYK